MQYTDKVLEHFMNPRNAGQIPDADGVGTIGSEECGDMICVWIKVSNEHLADIKYKVFGCPAAIASCSMMTELAIGKHIDDAWNLTDYQVADALGGLPAYKYHCSNLAASALHRAIMSYIFKSPEKPNPASLTILIDNTASDNLQSEHGLSFWLEYNDKRILFDTGQTEKVLQNARTLGINLADTDAIIISHGHYDHTGSLQAIINIAPKATLYLHPNALTPKFSKKADKIKFIGISDSVKQSINTLADKAKVVWTKTPTEIFPYLSVTGQIPKTTDFENDPTSFFTDENCKTPDTLTDDQALFFNTPKGLVVFLGCAHAGLINTLNHITKLNPQKSIYAVIGGTHLLKASVERIQYTIDVVRQYNIQKIGLAHCTGNKAVEKFEAAFPDRCFVCFAGKRIKF